MLSDLVFYILEAARGGGGGGEEPCLEEWQSSEDNQDQDRVHICRLCAIFISPKKDGRVWLALTHAALFRVLLHAAYLHYLVLE